MDIEHMSACAFTSRRALRLRYGTLASLSSMLRSVAVIDDMLASSSFDFLNTCNAQHTDTLARERERERQAKSAKCSTAAGQQEQKSERSVRPELVLVPVRVAGREAGKCLNDSRSRLNFK